MAEPDKKIATFAWLVAEAFFWIPGTAAVVYFWKDIREVLVQDGLLFGGYSVFMLTMVYTRTGSLSQGFRNVVSLLRIYLSILLALFFFLILFKK